VQAKLIHKFSCAPEGHTVVHFEAGSILTGDLAKVALEQGLAIEVSESPVLETKIETPKKKAKKG